MKKLFALTAAAMFCVFALVGCGGPTPTETVTQFLEGVKTADQEAIAATYVKDSYTLFDEESSDDTVSGMSSAMDDELLAKMLEFEYEVSNEVIDGDKATVDVKITTYSLGSAINSFMTDFISQALTLSLSGASDEEVTKLAENILTDKVMNMEKTYTETVTVKLTKVDGTWTINKMGEKSDFYNAITGGMMKAIEAYEDL